MVLWGTLLTHALRRQGQEDGSSLVEIEAPGGEINFLSPDEGLFSRGVFMEMQSPQLPASLESSPRILFP